MILPACILDPCDLECAHTMPSDAVLVTVAKMARNIRSCDTFPEGREDFRRGIRLCRATSGLLQSPSQWYC